VAALEQQTTASTLADWHPVADLALLPADQPTGASIQGFELVLVRSADTVHAYEGRCPHQGTLLAEGEIRAGALICRAHQWRFDCRSGQRLDAPNVCLRRFPVRIEGGQVLVELPLQPQQQELAPDASHPAIPVVAIDQLPGPRGLPLIGNLHQIQRTAFHLSLEGWAEQYGPLYAFRFGRRPMAVVSDMDLANAVLKARPEDFRRSSQLEQVSILGVSTRGIFMAEGERWRRQRPVIVQSLDTGHLRQFFPTLAKVTERLRRRWQADGADAGGRDVQVDLMRFTVDVTASLAFGQDINTQEQQGEVIQQHLDKIFPTIQRRLLAPFPYWRYLRLPGDRDLVQSVRKIYEMIASFVATSRAQLAARPQVREHPENLLQSLLVAAETDLAFDEREIADNVLTMLLAGEDTTANSLAWTLYFLARCPEIQERARAEVDTVLGTGALESFEQTRELPYIDAVINEAMRLKPVAPLNIVEANRDLTIEQLRLRRGDPVAILPRAIALREAAFDQPLQFDPERWLCAEDGRRSFNPKSFMPFGSGPRLCPGRSLALLEMKVVLAMIARHFRVEAACDLDQVTERLAFTMSPHGLRLRLVARG
jgi:cytochrome P450/nitrite reductase/ring-hydroxylating ferredoxin subunit